MKTVAGTIALGRCRTATTSVLLSVQIDGLASAQQAGVKLPDDFNQTTLTCLRAYYSEDLPQLFEDEEELKKHPGRFRYHRGVLRRSSVAMAAAGAVSLHKIGAGDDWRSRRSLAPVLKFVDALRHPKNGVRASVDPYTLFYVSQAIYLDGQATRKERYKTLCDHLVISQRNAPFKTDDDGGWDPYQWVKGKPGRLFATSVACLTLAMPQEKLPMCKRKK